MPRSDLTKVQRTLEEALSEQPINALGRKTGQTKRMRIVTPFRLLRTLLVAMAVGATETLADLCREFNFRNGTTTAYKAFYMRVARPAFPKFVRAVAHRLMTRLAVRVVRPEAGSPLARFTDIVIQDGTSFALKAHAQRCVSRKVQDRRARGGRGPRDLQRLSGRGHRGPRVTGHDSRAPLPSQARSDGRQAPPCRSGLPVEALLRSTRRGRRSLGGPPDALVESLGAGLPRRRRSRPATQAHAARAVSRAAPRLRSGPRHRATKGQARLRLSACRPPWQGRPSKLALYPPGRWRCAPASSSGRSPPRSPGRARFKRLSPRYSRFFEPTQGEQTRSETRPAAASGQASSCTR